jgi:hypothetical protein
MNRRTFMSLLAGAAAVFKVGKGEQEVQPMAPTRTPTERMYLDSAIAELWNTSVCTATTTNMQFEYFPLHGGKPVVCSTTPWHDPLTNTVRRTP